MKFGQVKITSNLISGKGCLIAIQYFILLLHSKIVLKNQQLLKGLYMQQNSAQFRTILLNAKFCLIPTMPF